MGKEADARHVDVVAAEVAPPEELITATDGEHGGPLADALLDCVSLRGQIRRHERLFAILAAADVEQIVLPGRELVAERDRRHLELVASERSAPAQHRDVAAVGVDVQVVRIQMTDPDLHFFSHHRSTRPRSARPASRSSIAV